MKLRICGLMALLVCSLHSAFAQNVSTGPFYGYRFGGEFSNALTGETYNIKDNPSYGIFLDIDPHDTGLRMELLYSFQDTKVDLGDFTTPGDGSLNVHVFQIGGIQELYDGRFRPYIGGYLGATWFDMPAIGEDLRFSFTVALGANYYLTRNLGVRLDIRGFGTVVESDGGLMCADGGCAIGYGGDVLWQGEVSGSLFVAF